MTRFEMWTAKNGCLNEWSKRMRDARLPKPKAVGEGKMKWEEEGENEKSRD